VRLLDKYASSQQAEPFEVTQNLQCKKGVMQPPRKIATEDRKLVSLRRTFTPYRGYIIIFTGVTLFTAYVFGIKESDWKAVWATSFLWLFFAFHVYLTFKYRILWDDTGVVMRASGLAERRIPYEEITEIRKEIADISEFWAQSRPFRRIVVYGRKHDPKRFIDISPRHFRLEDIEALLSAIRAHRPDLVVPDVIPWKN
jgi:hypothetical protein